MSNSKGRSSSGKNCVCHSSQKVVVQSIQQNRNQGSANSSPKPSGGNDLAGKVIVSLVLAAAGIPWVG